MFTNVNIKKKICSINKITNNFMHFNVLKQKKNYITKKTYLLNKTS